MKKVLALGAVIIISIMMLTACGGKEEKKDVTAQGMYDSVSDKCVEKMIKEDSDYLYNYYGIDSKDLSECVFYEAEDGLKVETLAFLKVADTSKADDIKTALETVKNQKMSTMNNYIPAQYEIAEKGVVGEDGDFLYLIISENLDDIKGIVEDNLK